MKEIINLQMQCRKYTEGFASKKIGRRENSMRLRERVHKTFHAPFSLPVFNYIFSRFCLT